jgi:hypothetical protein
MPIPSVLFEPVVWDLLCPSNVNFRFHATYLMFPDESEALDHPDSSRVTFAGPCPALAETYRSREPEGSSLLNLQRRLKVALPQHDAVPGRSAAESPRASDAIVDLEIYLK